MKKLFARWIVASATTLAALTSVSCVYDPYYTSVGYGGVYGGGFNRVDTSVFVSTGNSRWGYDPFRSCYFDFQRRCYYDPFLYGYYPVNYCPPRLPGTPHPYGWRPGIGVCPPPRSIHAGFLPNYHNRVDLFQRRNPGWNTGFRGRSDWNQQPVFNRGFNPQPFQQGGFPSGFSPGRGSGRGSFNDFRQFPQPGRQWPQSGQSGFGNRNLPFGGQVPQSSGFQPSARPPSRYQTPISLQGFQPGVPTPPTASQRTFPQRSADSFVRPSQGFQQGQVPWQSRGEAFGRRREQR